MRVWKGRGGIMRLLVISLRCEVYNDVISEGFSMCRAGVKLYL